MRTTAGGRASAGRFGVVRLLVLALSVLVVVGAGVAFALKHLRGGGAAVFSDFGPYLSRIDSIISDRGRAAEVSALADEAASFIQSKGLGVESELAVLKRRRTIARSNPDVFGEKYLKAALASAERLPHADALAAVVVDAAVSRADAAASSALKEYAPRLDASAFGALRTIAYTRLGATSVPSPELPSSALLAAAAAYAAVQPPASELLAVDASAVALLSGNPLEARTIVRDRLSLVDGLSPAALRFLAELAYDFGDRREAAAFFSRLSGPEYVLRRADSLCLVGELKAAQAAWRQATDGAGAKLSLYNLASTSDDKAEALSYARRLRSAVAGFAPGIVLFSRLADEPEGRAALSAAAESTKDVLVELELARIEAPRVGLDRTQARLWLLINKAPRSEPVARWAAWYAAANGRIRESSLMARSFGKEAGVAPWSFFYEGLEKAQEGKLDDAEKAFESAAAESGDWRLAANIAALYEAERKAEEALRRYGVAASLCASNADAAEIQLRIARLQKVLGRDTDARRTLEYALSKDPGNRRVRMELKRLNGL